MNKLKIESLDYHRNGICGHGFYVAIAQCPDAGRIVIVRYPKEVDEAVGMVCCSVLNIDELQKGNIAFAMGNSWRGDHYSDAMDAAIEQHNKALDKRLGIPS